MASYSCSNKTIHFWAIGSIADYWMFSTFILILPIFTTTFGMDPRLVGTALALPRLLDAILDPIIGHLSDNTHTRWGRRRPFLFVTAVMGAILCEGIWWMGQGWSSTCQLIFLTVMSTLLFATWGTYNMNHMALGYELTDDYDARTKVQALRGPYFSLAAVGGGWIYWLAERPIFGSEIIGIRWVSLGVVTTLLIAALITIFNCKERFNSANKQHVNLFKAIAATLRNRPFLVIVLLRAVSTFGLNVWNTMQFYVIAYSVCAGDKILANSLSGFVAFGGIVMSVVMVPAGVKLTKVLGKKIGLISSYGAVFVSFLIFPLLARPGHLYIYVAFQLCIFSFASSLNLLFINSSIPDICDIDELESGERREGLFAAVLSFFGKLQGSACILIGGFLLSYSGFDTVKAAASIQQTPDVVEKLRWLGFGPAIFFMGITFGLSFLFPLTRKKMDEVRAQLDERKKSQSRSEASLSESIQSETSAEELVS